MNIFKCDLGECSLFEEVGTSFGRILLHECVIKLKATNGLTYLCSQAHSTRSCKKPLNSM